MSWIANGVIWVIEKLIDPDKKSWTQIETTIGVGILNKFSASRWKKVFVPAPVFEAYCAGAKTVSTDVAIFDPYGRIYLVRREPNQLWPGRLHLPGVTHALETMEEANQRLLDTELSTFQVTLPELHYIGEPLEMRDEPRGPLQSNLFTVRISEIPPNLPGKFYALGEIPMADLVASHRTVIIPWLITHDYLK